MKNLKKLTRNNLKIIKGGKYLALVGTGGCGDTCTPNGGGSDDGCKQYGLTCGFFECNGALVNRCM